MASKRSQEAKDRNSYTSSDENWDDDLKLDAAHARIADCMKMGLWERPMISLTRLEESGLRTFVKAMVEECFERRYKENESKRVEQKHKSPAAVEPHTSRHQTINFEKVRRTINPGSKAAQCFIPRELADCLLNSILDTMKFNSKDGNAVLLYGPPGNGKTLLVQSIVTLTANLLNNSFSLYIIHPSLLKNKYVGETEKSVDELFNHARQHSPAIIFLDEVDGLISEKTESDAGHERGMRSAMLQNLNGFDPMGGIFVIAATNFPWNLGEGFIRRFRYCIPIDLPQEIQRGQIVRYALEQRGISGEEIESMTADGHISSITAGLSGHELTTAIKNIGAESIWTQMKDGSLRKSIDVATREDYDGILGFCKRPLTKKQVFEKLEMAANSKIPYDHSKFEQFKTEHALHLSQEENAGEDDQVSAQKCCLGSCTIC